VSIHLTN
jgi:hypothetical protein